MRRGRRAEILLYKSQNKLIYRELLSGIKRKHPPCSLEGRVRDRPKGWSQCFRPPNFAFAAPTFSSAIEYCRGIASPFLSSSLVPGGSLPAHSPRGKVLTFRRHAPVSGRAPYIPTVTTPASCGVENSEPPLRRLLYSFDSSKR